ncbi:MAG TPA: ABC transporter ATP-binding protein [Candidatus Tectomicrobia bacterium]|nr:ABC transporter ATP-binding protein [Candidatus Tectomicrobia bacterium]
MVAVQVDNVSKRFRRQTVQPSTSLKTAFVDAILHRRRPKEEATFQALKAISFTVEQGRTLGIIGRNGSGKSTLLKLLAGIYRPDSGRIAVQGKVGALLELGAGFHPEFSGRENILINGIVLGLTKREVRRRFDAIVRFAELAEFIDEPVKTYSSGMYMRLGFSVAVHADPDILLIDEILAVGDEAFHHKCFEKLTEFRAQGKTIILVSHDLTAVGRWSDEVLWVENGTVREWGKPQRVIDVYHRGLAVQEGSPSSVEDARHEQEPGEHAGAEMPKRWGSREVEIVSVKMVDAAQRERYVYESGEPARVILRYKVHGHAPDPVFGIAILRADDLCCYGSNTAIDGVTLPPLGDEGCVEILLTRLDFIAGTYYLDVAVHAKDGQPYDHHHRLYAFMVESERRDIGVFRLPHCWKIEPSPANALQQDMSAKAGGSENASSSPIP